MKTSDPSTVGTPENTEGDRDTPEPTAERDIEMEHSSDYLCRPNTRSVTKKKNLACPTGTGLKELYYKYRSISVILSNVY
jgi:hypothetical protein